MRDVVRQHHQAPRQDHRPVQQPAHQGAHTTQTTQEIQACSNCELALCSLDLRLQKCTALKALCPVVLAGQQTLSSSLARPQEPKLENARRIVAEWPALDQEAREFTAQVRFEAQA